MEYKKLHLIITLLGGVVAAILSMLAGDDLFTFGLKVALAIVIFYVLGSIIRAYMIHKFGVKEEEDNSEEDNITNGDGISGEDEAGGEAEEESDDFAPEQEFEADGEAGEGYDSADDVFTG